MLSRGQNGGRDPCISLKISGQRDKVKEARKIRSVESTSNRSHSKVEHHRDPMTYGRRIAGIREKSIEPHRGCGSGGEKEDRGLSFKINDHPRRGIQLPRYRDRRRDHAWRWISLTGRLTRHTALRMTCGL